MTELNWAFAGISTSMPAEHSASGALTKPMHTAWAHWIDSETEDEVNDEGDMFLQPDGTVLEKGVNEDGSTYEELWEELDAKVTGKDERRVSYVLRVEDPGKRTRGMCIRIGEWIQGTLRVGEEFTAVRWRWSVEQVSRHAANVWPNAK
jgi:Protein HRI1